MDIISIPYSVGGHEPQLGGGEVAVGETPNWKESGKASIKFLSVTLPETNIAPENGWLEYSFPFGMAYFQGRTVSFRECSLFICVS